MKYHLFQIFCGKMVKITEMSFLSTRGAVCFALNCNFYDILVSITTKRVVQFSFRLVERVLVSAVFG